MITFKKYKWLNGASILLVVVTSIVATGCAQKPITATAKKPNVILIMTDDQGYGDIAFNGNPYVKTPNMDAIEGSGVNFKNFHVDPVCSPTRAALMTGRYSARVGVYMTYMGRDRLNKDEQTMANVFKENNYKTAIFGKWHLGDNYPFRPTDRGFDVSLVHGSGVIGETPDYWGNHYYDDTYYRNNKPEKFNGYCTDIWFDEAEKFITANKNNPFFLYLPINAPHAPVNVPRKYVEPYLNSPAIPEKMAWYYGMIANIDENLGSFKEFLKKNNLEENTVFIFMTDNGTANGYQEKGNVGFNAGMRGIKSSPYEGGHRVSCVIRWPGGGLNTYQSVEELTAHIDLLPTLVDVLKLKMNKPVDFDGTSLAPIMYKKDSWTGRTLVVQNQVVFGDKLVSDTMEKYKKFAVMSEDWRLVNGNELYQIKNDPGQKKNVAAANPALVKQMQQNYEDWWASVSTKNREYNSNIIGSPFQKVSKLTSQDWHGDDAPYSQEHVRSGMIANGFWDIDVAVAGTYKFTLRRWPEELALPLDGFVPKPIIDTTRVYKGEKFYNLISQKFDVKTAKIKVADYEKTVIVNQSQTEIVFNINLKKGKQFIQTWLTLTTGETVGAYYVYVEKVNK